jgi:hypothetical protein
LPRPHPIHSRLSPDRHHRTPGIRGATPEHESKARSARPVFWPRLRDGCVAPRPGAHAPSAGRRDTTSRGTRHCPSPLRTTTSAGSRARPLPSGSLHNGTRRRRSNRARRMAEPRSCCTARAPRDCRARFAPRRVRNRAERAPFALPPVSRRAHGDQRGSRTFVACRSSRDDVPGHEVQEGRSRWCSTGPSSASEEQRETGQRETDDGEQHGRNCFSMTTSVPLGQGFFAGLPQCRPVRCDPSDRQRQGNDPER